MQPTKTKHTKDEKKKKAALNHSIMLANIYDNATNTTIHCIKCRTKMSSKWVGKYIKRNRRKLNDANADVNIIEEKTDDDEDDVFSSRKEQVN